jgi:hypothetical protein
VADEFKVEVKASYFPEGLAFAGNEYTDRNREGEWV